jgi:hypothetical protein
VNEPFSFSSADSTARRVDGRIVRGTRQGPKPVADQWVVIHRVGRDRAGPLDSVRTAATGAYTLRYHTSGDSTALYFVSTTYGGVAYFTSPLRAPVVRGDDATLTVFDTTSAQIPIQVGGRHLVIGAPGADGRRPIGEVYDLQNDSTLTLISRDSANPSWTTHIPNAAADFQLNASSDLRSGAIARHGNTVGIFIPLSPGIRQVAFTYELPANAFPLSIPLERATGIFEFLLQEPTATIKGIPIRETAPQEVEGRTFRRFLSQDLPATAVATISVPRVIGAQRERVYIGVAAVLIAAMAAALVVTARRSFGRARPARQPIAELRSQQLLRAIAALDAEYERVPTPDDGARESYEARRNALKAELTAALAAERKRS